MTSPVIDISHHNPTPDWWVIREAGVIGVIHKATEGTSYVDDTLFVRARDAMAEGLCWATYHFLRPGDMQAQMQHYLSIVQPRIGERVVIDHEDDGVSIHDLKNAVAYIREARDDLQIAIYSGHLIKEQLGNTRDDYLRANTSLWIAQYTSADEPSWPSNTWDTWSLWQWTDSEDVPGISAPVDGDRWNGTIENLHAWFGPAAVEPVPPEPEPEVKIVEIAIKAPEGVQILISVNGEEI